MNIGAILGKYIEIIIMVGGHANGRELNTEGTSLIIISAANRCLSLWCRIQDPNFQKHRCGRRQTFYKTIALAYWRLVGDMGIYHMGII